WSEDGSKTATMRANTIWKKVVEDFKAPSLHEGAEEALREFVARRTREGGAFPA
ncbi:MAG: trimethylamine methyltransferase, partial [Mesorhizobium sp.]